MLHESGVVHVRGTPATGKTTLAQLLAGWLAKRQLTVLYMGDWQADANARTLLVKKCHEAGYKGIQELDFLSAVNNNLVFIIDEAQVTYENSHLWYSIIKSRIGSILGAPFLPFQFLWQSDYRLTRVSSQNYTAYPQLSSQSFIYQFS